MSNRLPLISVIMPAHNAARFIGEAIQSVLMQTYGNWELIIIDDASSDGTQGIVEAFPDERIRFQRVERIGSPAGVRNVGLRLAQGDFIAFLDADDRYFSDTLETLWQQLMEHPEKTAVYGFSHTMDEQGRYIPGDGHLQKTPDGEYKLDVAYVHTWQFILAGYISCLLPALMLRRDTLERVGLFNEDLCGPEDYEFYIRLFLDNLDGVMALPKKVYQYRVYPTSLTKDPKQFDRLLQSGLKIMNWIYAEPALPKEAFQHRSKAFVRCYHHFARERLLHQQSALARHIVYKALRDKNIRLSDWIEKCLPVWIRSWLPLSVDRWLVNLKLQHRLRYQVFHPSLNPGTQRTSSA